MSITSDIRSYADTAVSQGKQVLDQAQTQLNEVGGTANEYVGKARENVSDISEKATTAVIDLRTSAEKAINLEAIKSAVEPYLSQVKGYSTSVTDRAESAYESLKKDKRFAKVVETAESVTGVVVEQVENHVVKPLQSLTGRGSKPAPKTTAARKPRPSKATKPAVTKPAGKPTARKAPAKKTTSSSTKA